MSEAAVERRIIRVPPVVAFGSRFGRYAPETDRDVRKAEVHEDHTMTRLKSAFKKFASPDALSLAWETFRGEDQERLLARFLKGLEYSAGDVTKFSIALSEFQRIRDFETRAGLFLSLLINKGKERDYVIHTGHLDNPPNYLGWMNRKKNIVIKGPAGEAVGRNMSGGKITVEGDAGKDACIDMTDGLVVIKGSVGFFAGTMEGGKLIIEGNSGGSTGLSMKGGKIIIKGKAGNFTGDKMEGGEIHAASIESCVLDCGGKIYCKGILLRGEEDA